MRKAFLLFISFCFFFPSKAQFQIGLSGGINFSNAKAKYYGTAYKNLSLVRLNGGIDIGYFFDENWGVQSGIYYAGKGWKIRIKQGNFDSIIIKLNYFETPLKVNYRIKGNNDNCFVASTGVYFAYGFSGKIIYIGSPNATEYPFRDGIYKRFDSGYLIESSYVIKNNYTVKLGFTHGLKSLRPKPDKLKNFLFNFSIMVVLNKK
jgi:hypothetical protein